MMLIYRFITTIYMQNLKLNTIELNRITGPNFKKSAKFPITIILDNVRSGHNIGSVFRTADAFNAKKIYLAGISAVPPNKEILKTALGSTDTVDWEYITDLEACIKSLKETGNIVYAVEQTINSISLENFSFQISQPIAVIFGNEVEGVNQSLINLCDGSIEIPQFGTKHSLNVSVTAGIVLWHFVNQILTHRE